MESRLDVNAQSVTHFITGTLIDLMQPEERAQALQRYRATGQQPAESPPTQPRDQWPTLVARVARFANATDRGVGDTLERVFAKFGGRQFEWLMKRIGIDCGCADRKAALNANYPYHWPDVPPT